MLDIALLGTSGMMPLPDRYLSSALLRYKKQNILIDCGEGTQVTLNILGWGFKQIDILCLTHFHADHVSGLPGFLHSLANAGKATPLTIIGPTGLKHVVESLLVIAKGLPFAIDYRELHREPGDGVRTLRFGEIAISCLFVEHGVPCLAYRFDIARPGKFDLTAAQKLGIPRQLYRQLQQGHVVEYQGQVVTPDQVMGAARKGFRVTYCTDSRPVARLATFATDSDLFICEGIYGDNAKLSKAKAYNHMLFSEAANLAKTAKVMELWLTHYSPSLSHPEEWLMVASQIFPNTHLGYDRKTTTLGYVD